jgi:GT2 family glycosyltransferase
MQLMQPMLSLIVLGYRNFDATTRVCLDSLVPWLEDPELEILVVDNGSPDDSVQKTADWCAAHTQVRCLLSESNRGFAGGMNWGAEQASGKWLLLVNNDTIFPALAIQALKRVLSEVPLDVAMLGPVTNAAGNGQRLWQPGTTHAQWMEIGQWIHNHPSHQLMPAYRCDFFCIAIRRDVWRELGGLDPAFGLGYYEDFDFSLRLTQAGYQQVITEDVFVLHVGSATFKASAAAKALMKQNKKLLQSKHPNAQFEHTRLGNLAVLRAYQDIKSTGQWTDALERRLQLRIGALEDDAPRSILKKWLWKKKIAKIL